MTRATRTAENTGATTLCLYLAFELGAMSGSSGSRPSPGPRRACERCRRAISRG